MLTWTLNKVLWKSRQPRLIHHINYYTVKKYGKKKANDVFNILETGVWNIQRFLKILHRWRAVRPSETFCKVQIKYQV